jgi:hypothetical protein
MASENSISQGLGAGCGPGVSSTKEGGRIGLPAAPLRGNGCVNRSLSV